MRAKWHGFPSSFPSLCECSSPNIFYGYLAYFPIRPSAPSPWSRWRETSSSTEHYCHEKLFRRLWLSALFFSPSACVCVCVCGAVGAVMIFPGQAQVGVQVYSIYVCVFVLVGMEGWGQAEEMSEHYGVVSSHHLWFLRWPLFVFLDLESLSLKTHPWLVFTYPCDVCLRRACFLLSVCVYDGRFTKGPWGYEGHSQGRGKDKSRAKNLLLTAHPQQPGDVLLDGSSGKIPRLTA